MFIFFAPLYIACSHTITPSFLLLDTCLSLLPLFLSASLPSHLLHSTSIITSPRLPFPPLYTPTYLYFPCPSFTLILTSRLLVSPPLHTTFIFFLLNTHTHSRPYIHIRYLALLTVLSPQLSPITLVLRPVPSHNSFSSISDPHHTICLHHICSPSVFVPPVLFHTTCSPLQCINTQYSSLCGEPMTVKRVRAEEEGVQRMMKWTSTYSICRLIGCLITVVSSSQP